MNERIAELLKQATSHRTLSSGVKYDFTVDQEKFADLIIQECIHAVENTNDRYRRDYFAEKIREHFGVES